MRHACDVCEGICNGKMLRFSCYCKYTVLVFGDDGAGPADEYRTKRVQVWFRQIMVEGLLSFAILSLCEITTSFM